jgi:hypothetical protein
VKVDDFWVRREDGPWVIAYRLVLQGGRLVIGELRVYPRQYRDSEDVESGVLTPWDVTRDLQGINGVAPAGGLTASFVHGIRPGQDVNIGRDIVRGLKGRDAAIWRILLSLGVQTDEAPAANTHHRMGGPQGKGLAFYREVARVYLAAPSRPTQAVAKAKNITVEQARDAVYRARHRYGLLPLTSRGKAGGADIAALRRIADTPPTASRTASRNVSPAAISRCLAMGGKRKTPNKHGLC